MLGHFQDFVVLKVLITSLTENSSSQNTRAADPKHWSKQCCGSVTFWCGSLGPYHEVRIRNPIRLRILLFSSVADKRTTKNKFFSSECFCFLFFKDTFTDLQQSLKIKSKWSHKTVEIKGFLLLLVDGRIWIQIRIRTNNDRSRWPKNGFRS